MHTTCRAWLSSSWRVEETDVDVVAAAVLLFLVLLALRLPLEVESGADRGDYADHEQPHPPSGGGAAEREERQGGSEEVQDELGHQRLDVQRTDQEQSGENRIDHPIGHGVSFPGMD